MKSKMLRYLPLSMGLISCLLFQGAAQAGPSASMLADTCAGCHGPNGVTRGPASPTLAGMTDEYLILSMQDYKKDVRKATIMSRIAKGYTDEQIKTIAKFFARHKYASFKQSPNKSLIAKGNELQQQYCESCHEEAGAKADGIGVLAGQPIPYLNHAIADLMNGNRPMERRKKQKMGQLQADAGAEGFRAVVHFYGSR